VTEVITRLAGGTGASSKPVGPVTTANDDSRTVQVVWLGSPDVERFDYSGAPYIERLPFSTCDLSRLASGSAPITDSHLRQPISVQLGVVKKAWFENGVGLAELRISDRPELDGLWNDIKTGVVRNLSLETEIFGWSETPATKQSPRIRTAVSWRPLALSFVTVPADPGAVTRSQHQPNMEKNRMETNTTTTAAEPQSAATTNRAQEEATIRTAAAPFTRSLPTGFVDDLVARGIGVNEARNLILNRLAEAADRNFSNPINPTVTMGRDRRDGLVERMAEALQCRLTGGAPSDAAREFWGASVADMAGELLTVNGQGVSRWDRVETLRRAMATTSDFPNLLKSTGERILMQAYQAAQSQIKRISRPSTANDFRTKSVLRLGEAPKLLKVNETGEIEHGPRAEAKESYRIYSYARIFGITREALINDDLGAFADFGRAWGVAAASLEAQVLVDLLVGAAGVGPTMGDNKALFHTGHGNLAGSAAAISDTTLTAARLALRTMKGLDGTTVIEVAPRYLIVPAAKETEAQKAIASIYPATTATANAFANALELLVEPRLDAASATRWYMSGDPSLVPSLEHSYLAGYAGPLIDVRPGFDVLGTEFRAVLDFGAGVLDYRGLFCNPGA
jgi:hypothetical protein